MLSNSKDTSLATHNTSASSKWRICNENCKFAWDVKNVGFLQTMSSPSSQFFELVKQASEDLPWLIVSSGSCSEDQFGGWSGYEAGNAVDMSAAIWGGRSATDEVWIGVDFVKAKVSVDAVRLVQCANHHATSVIVQSWCNDTESWNTQCMFSGLQPGASHIMYLTGPLKGTIELVPYAESKTHPEEEDQKQREPPLQELLTTLLAKPSKDILEHEQLSEFSLPSNLYERNRNDGDNKGICST
jgi:hypothetical protein